ncbi:alpha/beta fold hydrolase [Dactylosporangium sucinum]|uniref:AB hydrolase-1 domain-containing protein n=1 Tax=Dactylosporangium sucinum TaxID=1424081 RepID=A0A917TLQ1_9ACTN|nr:alpha/beta fold hydrolase [Dactylosporangium sucinum]GGM27000.1 hypothetical protein GCM10007977_030240 [Dactylosporangium sucinum]
MPFFARRIAGVLLVLLAIALPPVAALAVVLATAAVTDSPPLFLGAGALTLAGSAYGLSRAATVFLVPARSRTWVAALVAVAWLGLGAAAVLPAGPHPAAGATPAGVRFWSLPTGSGIAYVHAPATARVHRGPVVFLHGGPGTPGEGLPAVTRALTEAGFDVYAYDQLGAGRSTRLRDVTGYTVARHVADLEAIRALLGVDRMILVGQSWGASLAAQYLARHPANVRAVVFTGPGPIWPGADPGGDTGDPWARMTPSQREQRDELLSSPRVVVQALLQQVNPNAAHAFMGDDEADELLHRVAVLGKDTTGCPGSQPARVHDNHQGFYSNQRTVADFDHTPDPRPALRTVRVPALILRGECDFVPPETAEEYRRTLPGAKLVAVPGAGHAIAANQPERYRESLVAFLDALD